MTHITHGFSEFLSPYLWQFGVFDMFYAPSYQGYAAFWDEQGPLPVPSTYAESFTAPTLTIGTSNTYNPDNQSNLPGNVFAAVFGTEGGGSGRIQISYEYSTANSDVPFAYPQNETGVGNFAFIWVDPMQANDRSILLDPNFGNTVEFDVRASEVIIVMVVTYGVLDPQTGDVIGSGNLECSLRNLTFTPGLFSTTLPELVAELEQYNTHEPINVGSTQDQHEPLPYALQLRNGSHLTRQLFNHAKKRAKLRAENDVVPPS